uniref:Uncharacterized protein n=1 Tax=Micrurus lemniscatus lemniscatus TaxID=129467 RepID=A0A2D4I940_MICLE
MKKVNTITKKILPCRNGTFHIPYKFYILFTHCSSFGTELSQHSRKQVSTFLNMVEILSIYIFIQIWNTNNIISLLINIKHFKSVKSKNTTPPMAICLIKFQQRGFTNF